MRQDPVVTAKRFAAEQVPEALAVVLGGSAGSGRWNDQSDLDIVAVLREEGDFFRKVFRFEGWRIECIVLTPMNYRELFDEGIRVANPSLQRMLAEGNVLSCSNEAEVILEEAARDLETGPMPLSSYERDDYRYRITDHVEDVRGERSAAARWFAAAEALKLVSECVLRMNGRWIGEGKYLLRLLEEYCPGSQQRMEMVLTALLRGNDQPLVEYCADLLEPFGGFLLEGHEE